mgnify:CR=1 FL=1
MYNIFQVQHLINCFKYYDEYGIPDEHYPMTIISLLEHTDKEFSDISFFDIEEHYYEYIFGKY